MSIDGLVRRLERDLLQSKPIQRGERMEAFFGSQKYNRKRGMRMTEYNLLWQKGIEELKEVDIDLGKLEDVAGWFYLRNSGLSHEQKERVLAILPDEHYPMELLKKTLVRLSREFTYENRGRHRRRTGLGLPRATARTRAKDFSLVGQYCSPKLRMSTTKRMKNLTTRTMRSRTSQRP